MGPLIELTQKRKKMQNSKPKVGKECPKEMERDGSPFSFLEFTKKSVILVMQKLSLPADSLIK